MCGRLTMLNTNLARTHPLLSMTGRRRCSLPFWNSTRVGSCRDHDEVSTRNLLSNSHLAATDTAVYEV